MSGLRSAFRRRSRVGGLSGLRRGILPIEMEWVDPNTKEKVGADMDDGVQLSFSIRQSGIQKAVRR